MLSTHLKSGRPQPFGGAPKVPPSMTTLHPRPRPGRRGYPGRKWENDGQTTPCDKCMICGTTALTYHLLERGGHRSCQGHVSHCCGEAEGNASDAEDVPGAGALLIGETCNCKRNTMTMERKEGVAFCNDCATVSSDECVVRASGGGRCIEARRRVSHRDDNLLAEMQQMAAAIPTDPDTESKFSAFSRYDPPRPPTNKAAGTA
jgi:hypothetical protein